MYASLKRSGWHDKILFLPPPCTSCLGTPSTGSIVANDICDFSTLCYINTASSEKKKKKLDVFFCVFFFFKQGNKKPNICSNPGVRRLFLSLYLFFFFLTYHRVIPRYSVLKTERLLPDRWHISTHPAHNFFPKHCHINKRSFFSIV